MSSFMYLSSYLASNVRSEKKYSKRSSNTLLRLLYFFSEWTLERQLCFQQCGQNYLKVTFE